MQLDKNHSTGDEYDPSMRADEPKLLALRPIIETWVDSRVMIRLESRNNAKADVKRFTLGRASEL